MMPPTSDPGSECNASGGVPAPRPRLLRQGPQRKIQHRSQTFGLFVVCLFSLLVFCGLGMDAGLLYLSQARLSRACDAAVLAAGRNMALGWNDLALLMREIAVANYAELKPATNLSGPTTSGDTTKYVFTGVRDTSVTITFRRDGDRFIATCDASTGQRTAFMGLIPQFQYFQLGSGAQSEAAKPRMIALLVDRSLIMIDNGGAADMEVGVTNFFGKFNTNFDLIGFYTYSSYVRREFPITNDFWRLGTNRVPAPNNATYAALQGENPVNTNCIRFAGMTAADEALRQATEDMLAYPNQQDYQKYVVFFSGSQMNSFRTLVSIPAYTNVVLGPPATGTFTTDGTEVPVPFAEMATLPVMSPTNLVKSTDAWGVYLTNLSIYFQPGAINVTYRRQVTSHGNSGNTTTNFYVETNKWLPTDTYRLRGNTYLEDNKMTNIYLRAGESNVYIAPGYTNLDVVVGGFTKPSTSRSVMTEYFLLGPTLNCYPTYGNGRTGRDSAADAYACDQRAMTNLMTDFMMFNPQDVLPNERTNPYTYPGAAFYFTRTGVAPAYPNANQYPSNLPFVSTNMLRVDPLQPEGRIRGHLFFNSAGVMANYTNLAAKTYTNFSFGRPSYYYSFQQSRWVAFTNWVDGNAQIASEARWKSDRYVDYLRGTMEATVFTIALQNSDSQPDYSVLREMANQSTDGTYNPAEPEGRYYEVINSRKLVEAFNDVANDINELTLTR